MKNKSHVKNSQHYSYLNASGKIPYGMTNDYMFRIVLQKNEDTLKNLICSILHLSHSEIKSIKIENPIILGDAIDEKEYHLDVLVLLNNDTHINLEMQVVNYKNWPDRSVAYLSRVFNDITRGIDYDKIEPVYHIGFLDFTLYEDHPEFFAKYHIRNDKDNHLYTDKFHLYVVELNHTDLATDEDRLYGIDTWAKLFKATTWEEIKMITKDNPSMNSTAESIFLSNSDLAIRQRCRAREDAIIHEKYQSERIAALSSEVSTLSSKNSALSSEVSSLSNKNCILSNENCALSSKNSELYSEVARLHRLLEEHGIKAD